MINSKYSLSNINSNLYQTISIGSSNNNLPLTTLTSGETWTQGYIWAPYIPMQLSPEIDRYIKIQILKKERKEKLEKLEKLNL
jgi:hypothetical protein